MARELTIYSNRTFINPELNGKAKEVNVMIASALHTTDRAKVESAKIFAEIEAKELFKDDGFTSTLDFMMNVFNAPKSTAYQYLQVGRALNLGQIPEQDANGYNFAYSMLTRMVSATKTKELKEAVDSGEITAKMTQKEVDEACEPFRKPRKKTERKEREMQIFCTEDTETPTAVTTVSHFKELNGEPFAEFTKDTKHYMLYLDDNGYNTLYYYGGRIIDTEAVASE